MILCSVLRNLCCTISISTWTSMLLMKALCCTMLNSLPCYMLLARISWELLKANNWWLHAVIDLAWNMVLMEWLYRRVTLPWLTQSWWVGKGVRRCLLLVKLWRINGRNIL